MSDGPVTIKRYRNRRLCNPGAARCATLGVLGAGITHFVLKQIILERTHHG